MRRGVESLRQQDLLNFDGLFKIALAEAEARAGDRDRAVAILDEALATADRLGYRAFEAELHRARGEILLEVRPRQSRACGRSLPDRHRRREAARHAQLRTARGAVAGQALPIDRPPRRRPRRPRARARRLFADAGNARDRRGAGAAGGAGANRRGQGGRRAAAATDAVARRLRQRAHRRARLRRAGNDGSLRQSPRVGVWRQGCARTIGGRLRLMGRQLRARRLAIDAGARSGLPQRRRGETRFARGRRRPSRRRDHLLVRRRVREARDHLERALALFQPGRDDDLAFRFGLDPGVGAMAYLAIASWPLGEVDRAISLIDRMQTRIAGLTHVGTLAVGRMHRGLVRIDARRPRARRAERLRTRPPRARARPAPCGARSACFSRVGRPLRAARPADGLEDMRRGVELLREQNVLMFDGLLKIALAEAEARAGDPDRAVAILDEALATCDRTGLSRVRSGTASGARRNPAQARPRQPRARGRSLPDRHRRREAARHAQLRTARGAVAGEALPIDRPPRRRPRRPRARARRLFADAGNAGDRRGAGAARGAGGDRRGQGRSGAATAADAAAASPTATRSSPRAASARRKRRKPSPEPASRRLATRTRPDDWRPTTVCGPAATFVASCPR